MLDMDTSTSFRGLAYAALKRAICAMDIYDQPARDPARRAAALGGARGEPHADPQRSVRYRRARHGSTPRPALDTCDDRAMMVRVFYTLTELSKTSAQT
jgi:hypothetical protein